MQKSFKENFVIIANLLQENKKWIGFKIVSSLCV